MSTTPVIKSSSTTSFISSKHGISSFHTQNHRIPIFICLVASVFGVRSVNFIESTKLSISQNSSRINFPMWLRFIYICDEYLLSKPQEIGVRIPLLAIVFLEQFINFSMWLQFHSFLWWVNVLQPAWRQALRVALEKFPNRFVQIGSAWRCRIKRHAIAARTREWGCCGRTKKAKCWLN